MSILNREISPHDDMFQGSSEHYFWVGESALQCISEGLSVANMDIRHVRKILDLPCGHGRVLRHLCNAFPDAEITACDLDQERVDFCTKTFEAKPVYSNVDVSKISFDDTFDLIWVGSLLTHIDHHSRKKFWSFFSNILSPGGLVVVTLHGAEVSRKLTRGEFSYGLDEAQQKRLLEQYQTDQSGYVDYHHSPGYGITIATPEIYGKEIGEIPDLKLCLYKESAWDNHHDVAYCVKQERLV
jgi:SAM-dependent methyltransferase